MIIPRMLIALVVLLPLLVHAQGPKPEGRQYHLKQVDVDVSQTVMTYQYIDNGGFQTVLHNTLARRLDASDMLADADETDAIDLTIYVDYVRRFPGDGTPFPASTQTAPEFYMHINAEDSSRTYFNQKTELMTITKDLFGFSSEREVGRDIGFLIGLANTILKRLADVTPGDNIDWKTTPEEAKLVDYEYRLLLSQRPAAAYGDYIPQEVAETYITRLQSEDQKKRVHAYQDIGRDWINNKKLFDVIQFELEKTYLTTKSGKDVKEVREAMNALASSGLEEYLQFFDTVEKSSADKKIVKQVKASKKILTQRSAQGNIVHNTVTMKPEKSWRENQYANMLLLTEPKMRVWATKKISQEYPKDEYLLDLLAQKLADEALKDNFIAGSNHDFHAWICRAIGSSGNKKYLPVLQKVKGEASQEKVREYAAEFLKVLEKST